MNTERFIKTVLGHHTKHGRHDLPWRQTRDPYRILVSEIMLQQTQVSRVLKKYDEFLAAFPTAQALAGTSVASLLSLWKGLGYNRRALNLKRAIETIVRDHNGVFPQDAKALESLPGIGQSTRGAVLAFAFGIATPFIETNIRAVFIHHFFPKDASVADKELAPLIEKTLDRHDPRTWYYALMDYGVHLKSTFPNPSRKSAHHTKQSKFEGSNRQLRSQILEFIMEKPRDIEEVASVFVSQGKEKEAVLKNISALNAEGFLNIKRNRVSVTY